MKKNKISIILGILLGLIIILIFKSWFSSGIIASKDAPFYYWENASQLKFFPYLWQSQDLGYFSSQLYSFFYLTFFIRLFALFGFSWSIIERLLWYFPFIIFSVISSSLLIKTILPKGKFLLFSPFIFLFNTYALMIIGGGQISIALSYSLAPLVLTLFIKSLRNYNSKISVICGLITAIQLSFEPRITMLTIGTALFYYLVNSGFKIRPYKIFLIVFLIVLGVHFYWIFPTIIIYLFNNKVNLYSPSVAISDWLTFLSTARFSKSLSLLHPNWPENMFGKTSFMRSEFLLLPILAFSSLLFIAKKNNPQLVTRNQKTIVFFIILALLGAFLSKGVNPPLGEVYRFLFNNIPGFNLFRDPTKFYLLISLSYSILIPFTIEQIYIKLNKITRNSQPVTKQLFLIKHSSNLFLFLVTCCLLLLIKPAWTGELGGTFKTKIIPKDYLQVKNLIYNQKDFFRTLWIPAWQRYGYYDANHPSISAYAYFNVSDPLKLVKILKEKGKAEELKNISVKYLIIPPDPDGEYFSKDWKFDSVGKDKFDKEIDQLPYLKNKKKIGDIIIYELLSPKDHFWLESGKIISYTMINPTKYEIIGVSNSYNSSLIFSETYDPLWSLNINNQNISSQKKYNRLNSFTIPKKGEFKGIIEFRPQKYVYYGIVISALTLLTIIILLIKSFLKR